MYSHILIATDGTELGERGLDHGLKLAKALGAKVTVLTVVEPITGLAMEALVQGEAFDTYETRLNDALAEIETAVKARATEVGIPVEFLCETDSAPAAAIIRTAGTKGCDLIVMSTHGREGIERLVSGSQTARVVAHSTLPVLVVH